MDKLDCPFPKLSQVYLLVYLHRPIYPSLGQSPCQTLLYANTIVFLHPSMQIANFCYMNEDTQSQTEDTVSNMLLGG